MPPGFVITNWTYPAANELDEPLERQFCDPVAGALVPGLLVDTLLGSRPEGQTPIARMTFVGGQLRSTRRQLPAENAGDSRVVVTVRWTFTSP
jgi:hypothetical protein